MAGNLTSNRIADDIRASFSGKGWPSYAPDAPALLNIAAREIDRLQSVLDDAQAELRKRPESAGSCSSVETSVAPACHCEHGPNGPPSLRRSLKPWQHEFSCPHYMAKVESPERLAKDLRCKHALLLTEPCAYCEQGSEEGGERVVLLGPDGVLRGRTLTEETKPQPAEGTVYTELVECSNCHTTTAVQSVSPFRVLSIECPKCGQQTLAKQVNMAPYRAENGKGDDRGNV